MRYSICSINKARDDQLILFLPLFWGNQGKTWVLPVLPGMAPLNRYKQCVCVFVSFYRFFRKKYVRDWDNSLNCLMLIKAICQLMLSAGCLPIVALGYYYREDFFENVLSPRSCEKFGFFFFMNYAALNWIHCMMSFNRFMVFQCKIGKSD